MIKSTGHKLRPSFTPIYTKTSHQFILYNKMTAHKIDPNGSWFIDSLLLSTNWYLLRSVCYAVEMRRIEIMFLHHRNGQNGPRQY